MERDERRLLNEADGLLGLVRYRGVTNRDAEWARDVDAWITRARAALSAGPAPTVEYEQVGWHVTFPPFPDGSPNTMLWSSLVPRDARSGETWVPVYIVREDTDEPQRIATDSVGQPWNPRDQAILGGDPSL